MNTRFATGLALLILVGATMPVSAADLARPMATKAPPPAVVAVYNWSGIYIGGHLGYGWADPAIMPLVGGPITNHPLPNGALGGGQIGINWQAGAWIAGLESDASWGNLDDTRVCTQVLTGLTISCRGAPKYFGTIDGRIGYAMDRVLWYVKGGAAWSHEDFTQAGITAPVCTGTPCNGSVFQWGWNLGGGVEYAFAPNWSAKIEYKYMDFGHADTVTVTNGTMSNVFQLTKTIQTVELGLNYRFDWMAMR
jgi:outer membrane immunogenic protein